jgi:hypothetical protein
VVQRLNTRSTTGEMGHADRPLGSVSGVSTSRS